MRIPFRKRTDKKFEDLKAQIREFEATQAKEREDMKDLCIEIGRTLLACAMVETQLNDAIKYLTPRVNISNWLNTGEDRKMLAQAIREFRKRFRTDQAFYADLEHFRVSRNKFVHGIWGVSRSRLNRTEGRDETREFVRDLYQRICSPL